ncbi:N-acetylglucosamine kinase [Nocardiopsis kunsanensis]|uniref:N-acetylglucosamine kinase n=1 Tax=Nocardiopsis kunsanensis TaxID=141693 RepID=A0A918XFS8_9ACTN|nr:BadF/BadG/BcrA/BcrD ATPase family protein [Nocardiopsis kunsanensis]GHD28925.1 N-acetylglucosamine kinase [Nocardiopsis kunsanensis]
MTNPYPSHSPGPLVLGVDAGGTRTRALVTTLSGHRLGEAFAEGANPNSHGTDLASQRLTEAVSGALDRAGPGARRALATTAVGLAGVSALADGTVRERMHLALARAGVENEAVFTGDDEVAFASGTCAPDGVVLIAGTGAIAARVQERVRTDVADGLGWLVGDAGSGFWIGHRAARASARQLMAGHEPGPLTRAVLARALPEGQNLAPRERARALARALTAAPPIDLAQLAPLVSRACEQGDASAAHIVARAARHLADSVRSVRESGERTPVVLAGGVLSRSGPVRTALVRELSPEAPVVTAGCTAGGAAWTAALRAGLSAGDRYTHGVFTHPPEHGPG